MKALKKINAAYTLQIFAVIILLGNALYSSGNKSKEAGNNERIPLDIHQRQFIKTGNDSLLTEKINTLGRYTVKSW